MSSACLQQLHWAMLQSTALLSARTENCWPFTTAVCCPSHAAYVHTSLHNNLHPLLAVVEMQNVVWLCMCTVCFLCKHLPEVCTGQTGSLNKQYPCQSMCLSFALSLPYQISWRWHLTSLSTVYLSYSILSYPVTPPPSLTRYLGNVTSFLPVHLSYSILSYPVVPSPSLTRYLGNVKGALALTVECGGQLAPPVNQQQA
jgi:hypothetical protein